MSLKDKDLNFSLKENSQDYDYDETSWNREVDYSELEKAVTEVVKNYDFDESSWRNEIKK